MRFLDSFQNRLYTHLLRQYRDETFCQLLTLKLCNLAAAKFHFINRHSILVSKPYQLTVDPANACQLTCPGCIHSSNAPYRQLFDWPRSTLAVNIYKRFLEKMGPFAFCASLYNYGEPLLNKNFKEFASASKKHLLFTRTSTNLSMPLSDPEGIVMSGLDLAILSIDGTTQDIYEKYRRKGDLGLVFENVKKLVAAKKKLGSVTPNLVWQFLTFEHNAHQVNDAMRMAREFGVDEIIVQTPFGVEIDDPSIRPVRTPHDGRHPFVQWDRQWCTANRRKAITETAGIVEPLFQSSWEQRLCEAGADEEPSSDRPTCNWLYQNITLDGAARLMPCCMAPDHSAKRLVFANFDSERDPINPPMAVLSRLAFSNRETYLERSRHLAPQFLPYCASCTEKPKAYDLANVAADVRTLDNLGAVPRALNWTLTNWD